jgi:hypothetical protein
LAQPATEGGPTDAGDTAAQITIGEVTGSASYLGVILSFPRTSSNDKNDL